MRQLGLLPLILTATALGGCGSNYRWAGEGPPPTPTCVLAFYYQDEDGDGWGAGDTQELCEANATSGYTASNGRDCDDNAEEVTGSVGAAGCPPQLVSQPADGPTIEFVPGLQPETEYVSLYGDTVVTTWSEADFACRAWGGLAPDDATVEPVEDWTYHERGHLLTVADQAEFGVLTDVATAVIAEEGFAAWIGIGWDAGTSQWTWIDDSPDDTISSLFDYCDPENPPVPADFFPYLNPAFPAHQAVIDGLASTVRLAIVYRSGGWCLGLPSDAVPDDKLDDVPEVFVTGPDVYDDSGVFIEPTVYPDIWVPEDSLRYWDNQSAHFICEREKPDPALFEEVVTAEDAQAE